MLLISLLLRISLNHSKVSSFNIMVQNIVCYLRLGVTDMFT